MTDPDPGEPPRGTLVFAAPDVGYSELHWFLKSLQRRGLLDRLLLVCPSHYFAVHPDPAPCHIDDDCEDHAATVERIAAWASVPGRRLSGVIGVDEDRQFRLSRTIATRFGLPFHAAEVCERSSNKYLMKRRFEQYDVPTAPFVLLDDPSDPAVDGIGFPSVLKAVTSYGSQYIRQCDSREDLERSFDLLLRAARSANGDPRFRRQQIRVGPDVVRIDPRRQFLLERRVDGPEFSCDFLVEGATARVVRVARKMPGAHFGFFDGGRLLSAREVDTSGVGLARLTGLCGRIREALGAEWGVCMVDFKLEGRRLVVLEASIRPGLSAMNHLVYEAYGHTPLALMAMQRLGAGVETGPSEASGAVVYLHANGSALDAAGIAHLRARHGHDRVYVYDDSEDAGRVPSGDPSAAIRGYVVLTDVAGHPWRSVASRARGRAAVRPGTPRSATTHA